MAQIENFFFRFYISIFVIFADCG